MRIAEANTNVAWMQEPGVDPTGRTRALPLTGNEIRVQRSSSGTAPAAREHGRAPIWLAALAASRCRISGGGQDQAVPWNCVSGWAVYTNAGAETETIQPLGVDLLRGQTLAVCWMPGETGYRLEVYGRNG